MKVSEVVPETSAQSYHTPHPGMPMLWMILIPTWAMNTKKKIMKLKELSLLWRIWKKAVTSVKLNLVLYTVCLHVASFTVLNKDTFPYSTSISLLAAQSATTCCCHAVCQLMRQYNHVSRAYENCTTLQRKVRECSECPSVPEGTFIPVATQHFTKMEDKLA